MKIVQYDSENAETTSVSPGCGSDRLGSLPDCAPLAVPYVPFQSAAAKKYDKMDALSTGTLFPGLNLPFHIKTEASDVVNTPLAELQALGFVLTELSLYLDTHQEDTEAFSMYQAYTRLFKEGQQRYAERYGPLTHLDVANSANYTWLNDPWPWEGGND